MRKAFVGSASAFSILALLAACSSKEEATGQLMLSMQTDLSLPKDVNAVRIEVSTFGKVNFAQDYEVGPNGAKIPATLGIVAGANKAAPVRIRIIAKLNGEARLLREAVTTVPGARVAMLRMPLQYLSLGKVVSTGTGSVNNGNVTQSSIRTANLGTLDTSDAGTSGIEGAEPWASTCGEGKTSDNGACIDIEVDSSSLPDYSPAEVFGGGDETGNGTCFDTYECLAQGVDVNIDLFSCAFPNVPGLTNVGLRVPGGPGKPGICSDDPNADCFVPLDAETPAGWFTRKEDNMIVLPRGVCQKFQETKEILSIVYGTTCAPKTPSVPTCGPWSGVSGSKASPDGGTKTERDGGGPIGDGGIDDSGPDGSVESKAWIRVSGPESNLISLTSDGANVFYAASGGAMFRISAATPLDQDVAGVNPPTAFFVPKGPNGTAAGAGDFVEIAVGNAVNLATTGTPVAVKSLIASDRTNVLHAVPLDGSTSFDITRAPEPDEVSSYFIGSPLSRPEGIYFTYNQVYNFGGTWSVLKFCPANEPCGAPQHVGSFGDSNSPIAAYFVGSPPDFLIVASREEVSPCKVTKGADPQCSYYNPSGANRNSRSLAFDGSFAYFWMGDSLVRARFAYDNEQNFVQPTAETIYSDEKYGNLPISFDPFIDAQMQWEPTSSGNGYLYFSTAGGIRRLPISNGVVGAVEALPWTMMKRAVALQLVGDFVFWTACAEPANAASKSVCEVYRGRKSAFAKMTSMPIGDAGSNGAPDASVADSGVVIK